jgi:hypothetical protein
MLAGANQMGCDPADKQPFGRFQSRSFIAQLAAKLVANGNQPVGGNLRGKSKNQILGKQLKYLFSWLWRCIFDASPPFKCLLEEPNSV